MCLHAYCGQKGNQISWLIVINFADYWNRNTETNDDFCADENKDDLYIFFKKHGVIASTNASFLLQVYVEEVDRMFFIY